MTNKEYLIKRLSRLSISEDDIDIILLEGDIDGTLTADIAACKKAVYSRMSVVLQGAMQNISEGGLSISWNMEAVKLFYAALCDELGLENVLVNRPKVRNRSNFW